MNQKCQINKNKFISIKLAITLVLPMIFLGCAIHQSLVKSDSTTPKTDLAKLTVSTDSIVKLCEIDGVSGDYKYGYSTKFPCRDNMIFSSQIGASIEITMEPGPHTLTVCCVTPGPGSLVAFFPAHNINFVAKKGMEYELVPIYKGSYGSFTGNYCSAKVVEKAEQP